MALAVAKQVKDGQMTSSPGADSLQIKRQVERRSGRVGGDCAASARIIGHHLLESHDLRTLGDPTRADYRRSGLNLRFVSKGLCQWEFPVSYSYLTQLPRWQKPRASTTRSGSVGAICG